MTDSTTRIAASAPAAHDRAVVFCCDDGYLPFAAMAALGIAAAHPARDFDICIVSLERLHLPREPRGGGPAPY